MKRRRVPGRGACCFSARSQPLAGIGGEWIARHLPPQLEVSRVALNRAVGQAKAVLRASEPVFERHGVAERWPVIDEDIRRLADAILARLEFRDGLGVFARFHVSPTQHVAHQPQIGEATGGR